jgi:TPR repeat protein
MRYISKLALVVWLTAGAGQAQDVDDEQRWRPLAEAGIAIAQSELGRIYYYGSGVPQDYSEAQHWFQLAAEQDYPNAQVNLGAMYYYGQGMPQDFNKAEFWFRKAADQAYSVGHSHLGQLYFEGQGVDRDLVAAHMHLNIACALGYRLGCKNRDTVSTIMIATDISEAQRRARVCMESDYKDCD